MTQQKKVLVYAYLYAEVVEVMDGVGGAEGEQGCRGGLSLLAAILLLLLLPPAGKILAHVLQPLDEPLLLTVGPKMGILIRVQLLPNELDSVPNPDR